MREHDDDISNPMRAHSGRWTVFLFEVIGAFFILGAIAAAIPFAASSARMNEVEPNALAQWLDSLALIARFLLGLLLLLPWLVLRVIGRDRPGLRAAGTIWLVLVLVVTIGALLLAVFSTSSP